MAVKSLVSLLPLLLPVATRWVGHRERDILAHGQRLSDLQLEDARRAGVRHPEKIRLEFVDTVPMPGGTLYQIAKVAHFASPTPSGMALGHGISIMNRRRMDRHLLIHEMVHVAQYERAGSIENFLRPYLRECLDPGYPWGAMEQEAIQTASQIFRG